MKERKNVYQLPAGDKTLEWYAKAVLEMKKRPTTDPTSWNYQAAMHGFYAPSPFWQGSAPLPSAADQARFWNQCQHGSWYFLPWHRMYLAYFEQIVGATIVALGGPADWALPYWNYSETTPHARDMPPAFVSPAAPTNGLWMAGRASNSIPARYVTLGALNTIPYTGDGRTSPLGFGGPESVFSHGGSPHGQLESLPHDMVHVAIGGAMGDPRTAGLDPIFWLHHANIDRLWQVWLNMGAHRVNPVKKAWLDFKFEFHDKNRPPVVMTSKDVLDTRTVLTGYTYQGVPAGAPVVAHAMAAAKVANVAEGIQLNERVDASTTLDVVAATNKPNVLSSAKTLAHLDLPGAPRTRLMNFAAFTKEALVPSKPAMSILHFEHITGKGVPPIHDVYINTVENDGNKEAHYAGSLSFFGVEESSVANVHQSGSGQHYALDVTALMDSLKSLPNWNAQRLDISIEPSKPMDANTSVTIGRISLYSE